jgi:hypothetical protein
MIAFLRQVIQSSLFKRTDLLTSLEVTPQDEHFFLEVKFLFNELF